MPSLTSAFVYVALSVASFFVSAFQAGSATSYALSLLSGFLSWLFFVPGLSAIRLLLAKRKSQGQRTPGVFLIVLAVMFPLLLSLAVNIIPTVGLVFVVVAGLKKRAMEKQNRN